MVRRSWSKRNTIYTRTFPWLRTREAPGLPHTGVKLCIGELGSRYGHIRRGDGRCFFCTFCLSVRLDRWNFLMRVGQCNQTTCPRSPLGFGIRQTVGPITRFAEYLDGIQPVVRSRWQFHQVHFFNPAYNQASVTVSILCSVSTSILVTSTLGQMGTLGTACHIGAASDGTECSYCSPLGGPITNFREASFTAASLTCEVCRCDCFRINISSNLSSVRCDRDTN